MTAPEKIVCDFIHEFVDKNWESIDRSRCDLTKNKKTFLEDIKINTETACWVIFEVANWAMDKEYLREIFVGENEDLNFTVLNINGHYIRAYCKNHFAPWEISIAEKKEKIVEYWV